MHFVAKRYPSLNQTSTNVQVIHVKTLERALMESMDTHVLVLLDIRGYIAKQVRASIKFSFV